MCTRRTWRDLLQPTGGYRGENAPELSVLQAASRPRALRAPRAGRPRAGPPDAEAPRALDPSKTLPAGFSVSIVFGADRSVLTARGDFTIVSPSPMVYRLLDPTGLTADVQVEPPPRRTTPAQPIGLQPVDAAGSPALAGRPR